MGNRRNLYFGKLPDTQSASANQIAVRTHVVPLAYDDDKTMTTAALRAKVRAVVLYIVGGRPANLANLAR